MKYELEIIDKLKTKHYVDGRIPLIDKIRFDFLEKRIKALEIAKKKDVSLFRFANGFYRSLKKYNENRKLDFQLTKDEFKLFLEVTQCLDKD